MQIRITLARHADFLFRFPDCSPEHDPDFDEHSCPAVVHTALIAVVMHTHYR